MLNSIAKHIYYKIINIFIIINDQTVVVNGQSQRYGQTVAVNG